MIITTLAFLEKKLGCFLAFFLKQSYFKAFFPTFMQERFQFEAQNLSKIDFTRKAAYCFHCSSEGEFEQMITLLEDILTRKPPFDKLEPGVKVELIFTSPSVEHRVLALDERYPGQVYYLRYPFFQKVDLKKWITAPVVIMVRYDFFPCILDVGRKKFFVLLAATTKKLRSSNQKTLWWKIKREFYFAIVRHYHLLTVANSSDYDFFMTERSLPPISLIDFRIERIVQRLDQAQQKLISCPSYNCGWQWLANFETYHTMIIGSAWMSDLEKLADIMKKFINTGGAVMIIPHKLCDDNVDEMLKFLHQLGLKDAGKNTPDASVCIWQVKGVLCELYVFFDLAWVGGGWESVHSLLEPYLSGARVWCGPRIERSTEYELISAEQEGGVRVYNESSAFNSNIDIVDFLMSGYSRKNQMEIVNNIIERNSNDHQKFKTMIYQQAYER